MVTATTRSLDGGIGDLATLIAAAPADAIGDAVAETLRQLRMRLEVEWAVVCVYEGTAVRLRVVHYAYGERRPSPSALVNLFEQPAVASSLDAGEPVWRSLTGDVSGIATTDAAWSAIESAAIVPLPPRTGSESRAALVIGSWEAGHAWTPAATELLRVLAALIGQALARNADAHALRQMEEKLRSPRAGGGSNSVEGRPSASATLPLGLIASESPAIRQALEQVEQVSRTSSTVLLLGETGVGKERFAQAIHDLSARGRREMVRVSCAAIPATLIESELFGRERGAYTGALTRQIGRFEVASGSTLFLDEIGELSAEVQAKLLRALEERTIERLGSSQSIGVNVRIIAATHRNLDKSVADGSFREDLFYRLNVFPIWIPPLRDRVEDIQGLAWTFIDEFSNSIGKPIHSIESESMRHLMAYPWPGNIRELRNVIERAVILARGPVLTVDVPHAAGGRAMPSSALLKDVETAHIQTILDTTKWRIRGKDGAAERLGLKPSTLETRMAKLGLTRPKST